VRPVSVSPRGGVGSNDQVKGQESLGLPTTYMAPDPSDHFTHLKNSSHSQHPTSTINISSLTYFRLSCGHPNDSCPDDQYIESCLFPFVVFCGTARRHRHGPTGPSREIPRQMETDIDILIVGARIVGTTNMSSVYFCLSCSRFILPRRSIYRVLPISVCRAVILTTLAPTIMAPLGHRAKYHDKWKQISIY
jgi:hypothetical protein